MTMQSINGPLVEFPSMFMDGVINPAKINLTLDAVGESVHCVGQVFLEGRTAGGSKTISTTGKIHWMNGAVTWASAGSTLRVGIQDVSAATSPAQGDGTFDVYKDLVQGTDAISATTTFATQMATGTKTIAHGDLVSVAFELKVRNGTDSVTSSHYAPGFAPISYQMPVVMLGVPTFSRQNGVPAIIIEFDDGTIGWLVGSCPVLGVVSNVLFASNTAGADEYGNIYTPNVPINAVGVALVTQPASVTADFEICLYSDPLGTPSLIEAITVDATQMGNAANNAGTLNYIFSTERLLSAGTAYGFTARPTTTSGVRLGYFDVVAASHWQALTLGDSCYAINRLDNAGAFADHNGGTAKTRRMSISLLVDKFDDGAGGGGSAGMKQSFMNANFSG